MNMYLVSEGSYSEYSIEGVFDTKEKAEKFRDYYQFDHLEEMPLNPETPATPNGDRYLLRYEIASGEAHVERISNDNDVWVSSNDHWEEFSSYGCTEPLSVHCAFFARDDDHAHKITWDRLTSLKAGATTFISEKTVRRCGEGRGTDTVLDPHSHWVIMKRTWRLDGKTSTLLHSEEINEKSQ